MHSIKQKTLYKTSMNKIFRFQLLFAFLLVTFIASAQKISFEAGFTNPVRYGNGVSRTFLNGNQLGFSAIIPLKNNFSLLTGALYTVAYNDKLQGYPSSTEVHYYTFGHFADVPLRAMYTLPLSKSVKLFAYAGPNLNIGLSQLEVKTSTYDQISAATTNLYTDSLYRVNLQLGAGGGIQWNKVTLKGGYDFGILNLNQTTTDKLFQKGWYATLSYEFGELSLFDKKVKKEKKDTKKKKK